MGVTQDGPRAPYTEVAADLRERITSGDLKPGHRLGSYREMAREYGVAGGTVQAALRVLRGEGLVVSYQGRGSFVSPAPGQDASPDLRAEVATLREDIERLQVQMMVVYERTGMDYPHEGDRDVG